MKPDQPKYETIRMNTLRPETTEGPLTLITVWSHSINVGRSDDFFIGLGTCYIFFISSTCSEVSLQLQKTSLIQSIDLSNSPL